MKKQDMPKWFEGLEYTKGDKVNNSFSEISNITQKQYSQSKVNISQLRKENPFLQLFDGISSTKAKRGQAFIIRSSQR